MNATLDLLRTRRSVPPHLLQEPGPDAAELGALLAIAARVPDHGKLAPWRFLVIDRAAGEQLGAVIAAAYAQDNPGAGEARLAPERARLTRAPLVVGIVSRARPHAKIPEWEQTLSAGACAMNLLVAAHAMGFAGTWLTEWFAFDRRVLDRMGLDPDERVAGFVHLGRAAEVPPDRPRPDLDAIVTRL